ncbi:MAG: cytochrome B5 [Candidatus Bathyarchaeota archaeon]|nr:MAG: cytochrome B5 [Candidatus Bathyarchaeota archaeon]
MQVTVLGELKEFTDKELEEFNGKNGKPTYLGYQGKVYDVSQSGLWDGGDHMGSHQAGKDITEEVDLAPHGEEVLERKNVKLVGKLV